MTKTEVTGSEPRTEGLAATWGGGGFRPRRRSHAEELGEGRLWHRCGGRSEVTRLEEVLLNWPGEELCFTEDPDHHLMLDRVDLAAIRRQTAAVAAFFEERGVRAHIYRSRQPPPPNLLFMRDLFFMTPEGAVLGRPASEQRAGEERFAAEALAEIGIPILASLRGNALFEGPDVLWLDRRTAVAGVGLRTNPEGLRAVAGVLRTFGVETLRVPMPAGIQHLLGVVNLIDRDLAAIHAGKAPEELKEILRERGFELLEQPADAELTERRGMNFVTLGPRRLVMPAGCPGMRARFEAAGVEVFELEVGEYLKAGGGLGCLVGILRRADAS